VAIPLHESVNFPAESLDQSWHAVREYVTASLEIIRSDEPVCLDREEVEMIREGLGDPPPQCYPLYFLTCGTAPNEHLVYIGKTSSSSGRFRGGHRAISLLHHPKYEGLLKTIYLGCVMLLNEDDYLPLEWIEPISKTGHSLSVIRGATH
jgi:hypothetical protein